MRLNAPFHRTKFIHIMQGAQTGLTGELNLRMENVLCNLTNAVKQSCSVCTWKRARGSMVRISGLLRSISSSTRPMLTTALTRVRADSCAALATADDWESVRCGGRSDACSYAPPTPHDLMSSYTTVLSWSTSELFSVRTHLYHKITRSTLFTCYRNESPIAQLSVASTKGCLDGGLSQHAWLLCVSTGENFTLGLAASDFLVSKSSRSSPAAAVGACRDCIHRASSHRCSSCTHVQHAHAFQPHVLFMASHKGAANPLFSSQGQHGRTEQQPHFLERSFPDNSCDEIRWWP